jgi:superfamily II DNA or RNA helicase
MPYTPASESCFILDTVVPDSMGYETHAALKRIKEAVGGDIDEYVRERLNYKTKIELCKALSAEQIDAVAMAIYNIEERGQGMIIGDQTGIGKGRIAASIVRYGVEQGVQPIFLTEKANLFSDIYRDLSAIGSAQLVPFIVNGRESKTDIKDEDGNVVYQALASAEQNQIFMHERVPANYDFVVATYSQFNSPDSKPVKPNFLKAIARENIIIMDEAHNSSGSGNTGTFMQSAIEHTRGVVFLSATFAKRPDNMPLYAMKTSIRDASLSREGLIEAITIGGAALQEVLASQLVAEGQMIRRERSFEGVEVNYITLDHKEAEHKAIADNITEIVRDIISFQTNYVDKQVEEMETLP